MLRIIALEKIKLPSILFFSFFFSILALTNSAVAQSSTTGFQSLLELNGDNDASCDGVQNACGDTSAAVPTQNNSNQTPRNDMSKLPEERLHPSAEGQEYVQDLKGLSSDIESLPQETVEEAHDLLKSPVTSPAAAKAYAQYMKDQQRQTELNKSRTDVIQDILNEAFQNGVRPEAVDNFLANNTQPDEYANKHLLVFISSSMPDAALSNFMGILGDNDFTAFVMRGVVDNDISKIIPTQAWVRSFLCPGGEKAEACHRSPVDINPGLFERFKITHVPAVVYVQSPQILLSACDGPVQVTDDDFLVFYGDFSPIASLNAFEKEKPNDPLLKKIITQITRKGFHQEAPEKASS